MNEFTPEYIELAKKVQGLRPKLENGDRYINLFNIDTGIMLLSNNYKIFSRTNCIWLPTGDQIDEEIIKICHSNEKLFGRPYWQNYNPFLDRYVVAISGEYGKNFVDAEHANPLIAKIKLLIQLLEGE